MQRDDKANKPAPHEVLGVAANATEDEIKKAYKKLALQLHPDRNRGNEEAAKEKFQILNEANAILMDPAKRKAHYARKEVPTYIKDIISAIINDNKPKVDTLLKEAAKQKGFDINRIIDERGSLIHIAASQGKPNAMTALLQNDADINKPDQLGNTPLHLAVKRELKGWIDTAVVLLEQVDRINVDAKNNNGDTALHLCADRGFFNHAQEIMGNEPHTDIKNNDGFTAEQIAANGKSPIQSKIAEMFRTFNQEEEKGFFSSLLDDAKEAFFGKKPESKTPPKDNTGTAKASSSDTKPGSTTEKVQRQLQDQHALCQKLQLAIKAGDLKTIKLMISQGADVNFAIKGECALHVAARSEKYSKDIIDLLIASKADINRPDNDGKTLLHIATEFDNHDLVEKLLKDKRTNVNAQDNNGDTALHIAVMNDSDQMTRTLSTDGRVDAEIPNNDGMTATEMFDLMDEMKNDPLPPRTKATPHPVNENINTTDKKRNVESNDISTDNSNRTSPIKVGK